MNEGLESEGFAYDMLSDDSFVLNAIQTSESPSNYNTCTKTSRPSTSTLTSLSSFPGNYRSSNRNQPCPGRELFGSGKRERFWKSVGRNVRKYLECFRVVAARPKDARRMQTIKSPERNTEEHDENLKALILHCKNS